MSLPPLTSYRPITTASFRLNHMFANNDTTTELAETRGFHLVNVALHALVSSLTAQVSRGPLGFGDVTALLTGVLFALHPVHVEAVTGLVGRAELLCAAFGLAAVLAYDRAMRYGAGFTWVVVSMALVLASFLSKETGITIMALLMLHEWFASSSSGSPSSSSSSSSSSSTSSSTAKLYRSSIIIATLAVFLKARQELVAGNFMGQDGSSSSSGLAAESTIDGDDGNDLKLDTNNGTGGFLGLFGSGVVGETHFGILDNHVPFIEDPLSRRLTLLHSYVIYAKLLIWPMHLSCDYTYDAIPMIKATTDPRNLQTAALAVLALFIAAIIRISGGRQRGSLLVCVAWFGLPFLPASQLLFYPGLFIGERALYLPSFGFILLLSFALGGGMITGVYGGTKGEGRILEVVMDDTAEGGVDRAAYGAAAGEATRSEGEPVERKPQRKKQRKIQRKPQLRTQPATSAAPSMAWHRMLTTSISVTLTMGLVCFYAARTHMRNKDWRSNYTLFKSAYEVLPGSTKVQMNLGVALWREGKLDDAEKLLQSSFKAALEVEPKCCQPWYWLGRVYIDKQEYEQAISYLQKGLECNDAETDRLSREALEETYKSFAKLKGSAATHSDLGNTLAMNGDFGAADREFQLALAMEPRNPDYITNYGISKLLQEVITKPRTHPPTNQPTNPPTHQYQADSSPHHEQKKDYTHAIELFREAAVINPDDERVEAAMEHARAAMAATAADAGG